MKDTSPSTVTAPELLPVLVEIVSVQADIFTAFASGGFRSVADAEPLVLRMNTLMRSLGKLVAAAAPSALFSSPSPNANVDRSLAARARDILSIPSSEAQIEALVGATPALWKAVIREIKTPGHDAAYTREVPTYLTPCAFADVIEVIITSGESDEADGYCVVEAVRRQLAQCRGSPHRIRRARPAP
jgi:hypothetical protein